MELQCGLFFIFSFLSLSLTASPAHRYTITGFTPDAAYEVRVSHPSSIPALVGISIEKTDAKEQPALRTPRPSLLRRSLLDTTRAGLAVGNDASLTVTLTVNATSRGFYPPGSAGPPPALPVAITVERLVGGVLPADAGPVVAACTVLLAAVLSAVPWWSQVGVRRVGEWLDGGEDEGDKAR